MVDFTISYEFECSDLAQESVSHVGGYEQRKFFNHGGFEWTCTCLGYKYRRICKHIKEAESNLCDWNSMYSEEKQTTPGICPKCGKETVIIKIGV
jgi:hypothetical protein